MRLKRMIALLCASLYILTGTAAAGEITKEETEQQIVLEAGVPAAEEGRAVSQNAAPQMLSARAALKTVPSTHKVTVNGQAVSPQAYNIDGYNYFKLRDIAFLLSGTTASFDVQWNGEKNAIDLISGAVYTAVGGEMSVASSSTLRVQESTAKLLLDGSGVSIKGYNINGNNYYKVRDIGEALGFSVGFESETVLIRTTEDAEEQAPVTNAASYTFQGSGWGHSVGMSQWGAYAMAQQGFDYEEILKFYFTGVSVAG